MGNPASFRISELYIERPVGLVYRTGRRLIAPRELRALSFVRNCSHSIALSRSHSRHLIHQDALNAEAE